MNKFVKNEKGQALVELALVIMLFYIFIIGIIQVVMIGYGWISLHQLARRAAWHGHYYNNTFSDTFGNGQYGSINQQLKLIANGFNFSISDPIGGSQKDGFIYELQGQVNSIGYFRLVRPKGFMLKTTTSVLSYPYNRKLGHPIVDRAVRQGRKINQELIQKIIDKHGLVFK